MAQAQAYIEEARQIRKEQDEAYQQSLEAKLRPKLRGNNFRMYENHVNCLYSNI